MWINDVVVFGWKKTSCPVVWTHPGMESLEEFDAVVHEPDPAFVADTNIAAFMDTYGIDDNAELIERTTSDIDWFWDELPSYLDIEFYTDYETVRDDTDGPQFSRWYPGGELNIAHNTLDRHAARDTSTRNRAACIWEGEAGETRTATYHDLYQESNQVANYLEAVGVEPGDTVATYMPMVPEVISILYGCFKAGAIVVPIFSGFGVDATATRLEDPEVDVLFTADGFYRRGNRVSLKTPAADAIESTDHDVDNVVVYHRFDDSNPPMSPGRDLAWTAAVGEQSTDYETRRLSARDESMLLYSSGTTGQPKGIVHTHAGAITQAAKEVYFGFDLKPSDRFFWVSDIGWMMGPWTLIGTHTFGGTMVMYEGAPDHPTPARFWELIDRHDVTQFGISPTAIRALRKQGDEWVDGHDLSSLRLLGSTGEPWDPESWLWFYNEIGGGDTPIINISGGTEIFGCFLTPLPNQALKPCTLGGPGLGMDIDIVDDTGKSIADTNKRGYLVARDSCPAMTKSLWAGDDRYLEEYWSTFQDPPMWDHGDWAQKDEDGFWFLHGRADDALNVAGRKVGPAEIEGALIDHDAVNQAAAVGVPDDTTGTAVVTYVVLEPGVTETDELREDLSEKIGEEHGKPFKPREVLFVDEFPKTQSGKIIRRAIASLYRGNELGDMSSIENPDALDEIKNAR